MTPHDKELKSDPQVFLNQFDFQCKYNKNYNRQQDCTDYLTEVKKEMLIALVRFKIQITHLQTENTTLKKQLEKLQADHAKLKAQSDNKIQNLKEQLQNAEKESCNNLFDLLNACKVLFKNDALGRLRLMAWLHNFDNIETSIVKYQRELQLE